MESRKRLTLFTLIAALTLGCAAITQLVAPASSPNPPLPPATTSAPAINTTPLARIYTPPDCEGTPVATVPPATEQALPTPSVRANPPIDQEEQLRIFDQVAHIISTVYIYPKFNGNDWQAIADAHRARIAAGLSTEDFYNLMDAMVAELGDNHSRFDSPVDVAESQAELAGTSQFVGIGILAIPQIDKRRIGVAGVFPDSPAEHSGLKLHDSILAVDGLPLVQDGNVYTYRVRGPECSTARLTVQSPGQPVHDVWVMRHKITGDIPIQASRVPTTDGSRVGYIMLPSFFDEKIPGEVADALKNFGTLDGLIIDNRFNGGGSSDVVERVLSFFVTGTLGQFRSTTASRPLTVDSQPVANSQTVPLVVLVGQDTASFGEIFSGILKDQGRAKVVGETSPGNVEILHGHSFEDGSTLWLAEETFDPAISHANWELTGIVPDVQAHADWDTITFENDPAILASIKLLGHK